MARRHSKYDPHTQVHIFEMARRRAQLFSIPNSKAAAMKYYEIRVFNRDGRASLIFHQLHANDSVAIKAAEEIAEEQPFEVWRGMDCIHVMPASPAMRLS